MYTRSYTNRFLWSAAAGTATEKASGLLYDREHAGEVPWNTAAGDMGDAVHGKRPAQLHDCGRIDHRRPQQLVGQAVVRTLPGRRVEVAATDVEQHAAGERVSVGTQARRQEPDQTVAGRYCGPGHDPVALSDSDGEAAVSSGILWEDMAQRGLE